MIKESKVFYENRSEELKKIVKKNYYKNLPDIVSKRKTKINVSKGWMPFTDSYSINITPKDKYGINISGEGYSDNSEELIDTINATVKKKKKEYVGEPVFVFIKPPYQGKGVGSHSVKSLMKSFEDFGSDRVEMHPAFDGPNTWSKVDEFHMNEKDKKRFLKKYKEYAKRRKLKFKDLGNKPSDYPSDFLKRVENVTFVPFKYRKNFKKTASAFYQRLMIKEAFFFRKSLEAKYKYLGDPEWKGNNANLSVISAKGKNKYHAIDNGDKISFKWNPEDASPRLKAANILMKIRKKRAKKLMNKQGK